MKRFVTIVTALGALVGALVVAGIASADHPIELGQTSTPPAVSCPDNCQAVGQVTGFEVQQGTTKQPFKRTRRGKVVAFSVTLGKPKKSDVDFFNKLFGSPPEAQIAVLKPGTKNRYRVSGISPPFDLTKYFGSTPTFALPRPLTVKPGYVVALTVPTWAPAFAVNLGNDEAWRSSRDPAHCDDVQQKAAQVTRGQLANYRCIYRTARLMYTATFIPDPRVTNPATTPKKKKST
ncbi:MAG TPA: hypothetical protein VH817_10250 [Thermoleophilaceae bacterium]|jgi:hypothetical protein